MLTRAGKMISSDGGVAIPYKEMITRDGEIISPGGWIVYTCLVPFFLNESLSGFELFATEQFCRFRFFLKF